jgi:hypothetical protein
MNLNTLHDELTADPLARGYAGMTDAEAAASLNTVDRPQTGLLDTAEIDTYLLVNGLWYPIYQVSGGGDPPTNPPDGGVGVGMVRGACAVLLHLLERHPQLDTSLSIVGDVTTALKAGGLVTQAQIGEIVALATTLVSRGAELGLGYVAARHVRDARALGA